MNGHLATAVDVVVLVSEILVLAFAAIELVPLPILGGKTIVAIPAIDDILTLASVTPVFARPTVEDVFAISSGEIVISAKAAYLVIAVQTVQFVWFVGA